MFTNLRNHGGDFRNALDNEFNTAENVTIASGYTSLDVIQAYEDKFITIAKAGGISKLLLGMAFYEGLNQKKLDAVRSLNEELLLANNSSGVYVANGRRYHGKVFLFNSGAQSNIYVGSSNFSASGTKGNIECTVPIIPEEQKKALIDFLNDLYSPDHSITIDKANITVPGKSKTKSTKVSNQWKQLKTHTLTAIDTSLLPKFEFPLQRVAEKEKSSLNVYFGKGRLNSNSGIVTPRPWYEIELIASNDLNSQPSYPRGDFLAFTDDGYIIPMRTQGDYYKNIRSRHSLQLFGIWLKGKLEKSGALQKYQPVTTDTLAEYGKDRLVFYKIEEGKYYMEF